MRQGGPQQRNQAQGGRQKPDRGTPAQSDLRKKPYGFVSLPDNFKSAAPIWHDGTSSKGRLSGEIRFELETLTPLLVGWERGIVGDSEAEWPVPNSLDGVGQLAAKKSVLCPLRAPWGKRPVVIPGDSLRGLLRHELGALLGAPMERVAERSYSYRPNALFPNQPNPRLIPRIARVPKDGVEMKALDDQTQVRVPTKLELLPTNLRYDKRFEQNANYYRFDRFDHPYGAPYRGGWEQARGSTRSETCTRNWPRIPTRRPRPSRSRTSCRRATSRPFVISLISTMATSQHGIPTSPVW